MEDAWDQFVALGLTDDEGAGHHAHHLHELDGGHQGVSAASAAGMVCTSSNANGRIRLGLRAAMRRSSSCPTSTLGRNTGFARGIPLDEMVVWDPYQLQGGLTAERLRKAKVILWKGHCSVHQRFLPEHVDKVRATYPGIQVLVHPECRWEVCQKADGIGSTDHIIKLVQASRLPGSSFAIGTEIHLVNRLAKENPGQARHHAWTIPAACVRPCFASRRSTCAGRWRTWWTATSSTRLK